jgi:hypothetical protein
MARRRTEKRNDQLINNNMMNKLKKFAVAALLTGATVLASNASTLYQTVSVNLVLTYYQNGGVTNSKGDVTYAADNLKLTSPEFVGLLATNLGITDLSKSAQLMRVTTLFPGTNIENLTTNATSLLAGYTVLTNIQVPMTLIWRSATNSSLFFTNSFPNSHSALPFATPPTTANSSVSNNSYTTFVGVGTNFQNYVIQGKAEPVILGNATYYIVNGSDLTDTNLWIPVSSTNNTANVYVSAPDEAEYFQNYDVGGYPSIDDNNQITEITGTSNYFGDYYNQPTNLVFGMNELLTNLNQNAYGSSNGPIFVGIVKTNFAVTGTLFGDTIQISTGNPAQPNGTQNFLAHLNLNGFGNATSTTGSVGHGKGALPFTSWNTTFAIPMGFGTATLGGYDTNSINTNFFFVYTDATASNGVQSSLQESPGFVNPTTFTHTTLTNPPPAITNGFTYANGSNISVITSDNPYEPYSPHNYIDISSPPYTYTVAFPIMTPDLTGYYTTNLTFTNVSTNVYTLNMPNSVSSDYTNYNSVYNPTTTSFQVSGSVKVTTVKISTP